MDDATQKLVDEAHGWCPKCGGSGMVMEFEPTDCPNLAVHRALEAAQRPPVSPEAREATRAVVGEQLTKAGLDLNGPPYSDDGETQWPVALELRDRLTDAILAWFSIPSQPPVSPEVREGMIFTLVELVPDGAREGISYVAASEYIDALLAKYSVPPQPVYDEEAIARWLRENHDPCITEGGCDFGYPDYRHDAAALVAALRVGELTREESDRG